VVPDGLSTPDPQPARSETRIYRTRPPYLLVAVSIALGLWGAYRMLSPESSLVVRITGTAWPILCVLIVPVVLRRRVEVDDAGLTRVAWRTRHIRWDELRWVECAKREEWLWARIEGYRGRRMLLVGGRSDAGRQEVKALATDIAAHWRGDVVGMP
jgi:hypothetical protein